MKKRTKAEMAKYRRELRARQKAQNVTPTKETPVTPAAKCHTQSPAAVSLPPAPCPECARLRAENGRLLARIEVLEAKARKPDALPQGDDAEALRQRVIATKINRINSFAKGHTIGTARI